MYRHSVIMVQSTNKIDVLKSLKLFQRGGPRDVGDDGGHELISDGGVPSKVFSKMWQMVVATS
jgi:hypothetical protein